MSREKKLQCPSVYVCTQSIVVVGEEEEENGKT